MNIVLTEEEKKTLAAGAQKLLFLIRSSSLTEEEKDAWAESLQYMSLEQIDDLMETLESGFFDAKTRDIDERFIKKLKEISK